MQSIEIQTHDLSHRLTDATRKLANSFQSISAVAAIDATYEVRDILSLVLQNKLFTFSVPRTLIDGLPRLFQTRSSVSREKI